MVNRMSANLIDEMTEREAKSILNDICCSLKIGGQDRTQGIILTCINKLPDQASAGDGWISVEDRMPEYSEQRSGEAYNTINQNNRNRYQVIIERNPEKYAPSSSGRYIDILGIGTQKEFYGYDETGKNTDNWRERVTHWQQMNGLNQKDSE